MSQNTVVVVTQAAYLTLHYRLVANDGVEIVSTFSSNPATILLGQGQLAPKLEECLLGLPEGIERSFDLAPENAFGVRNEDLIRRADGFYRKLYQTQQGGELLTTGF